MSDKTEYHVNVVPRSRKEKYCDRILVVAASFSLAVLFGVLAFSLLRGSGRVGASYNSLKLAVGLLVALNILFLVFRRQIYKRIDSAKLVLLMLSIVVPVVCIELFANLVNPNGYLHYSESERYFQWQEWEKTLLAHEHPANATLAYPWGKITTNSEGWRNAEVSIEHPAETLRVLALGDSVVFSWGVDQAETVTAHIEHFLAESESLAKNYRKFEVINTGNCSFNSIDQLIVLKSKALSYKPDAVILVAIDNDFVDRPAFVDQVEYLRSVELFNADLLPTLGATAAERSKLQQKRSGTDGALLSMMTYLVKRSFIATTAARIAREMKLRGTSKPTGQAASVDLSDPQAVAADVRERYEFVHEQTAAIKEIAMTCENAGIPFVLFTYRVDDEALLAYFRQQLGLLAAVANLDVDEGVGFLAILNSPTDSHWNADGTRMFGRKMADTIAEQLAK